MLEMPLPAAQNATMLKNLLDVGDEHPECKSSEETLRF
jgi:hypothetical protein